MKLLLKDINTNKDEIPDIYYRFITKQKKWFLYQKILYNLVNNNTKELIIMKLLLKDINTNKDEIPEKRLSSVSYNAIGSLLFLILIVADYSNDGFIFESISSLLTTKIVYYTFVALLIINLVASVLRFVFMKLGKDFTFVNDVVLLVIVSAILIVNFVISLATSGFNFPIFATSAVFVLVTAYYVFKEIKNIV